jgi:hypothetical protein
MEEKGVMYANLAAKQHERFFERLSTNPDLIKLWEYLYWCKNIPDAVRRGENGELEYLLKHIQENPTKTKRQLIIDIDEAGSWDKWVDTHYRYENPELLLKVEKLLSDFEDNSENKIRKNLIEKIGTETGAIKKLARIFGLDPAIKNQKIRSLGKKYIADRPNIHAELDELLPRLLQLDKTERKPYEVYVKNGELYNQKLGKLSNHSGLDRKDPLIFVLDAEGNIYVGISQKNVMQHSSFLSGEKVATAGQFHYDQNNLIIDRRSEHYEPSLESLSKIVEELTLRGVNISNITISTRGF